MSLKWLYLLIISILFYVSTSFAIKCYICGIEDKESLSCSNFQVKDPQFSRECESSSKSCRITRKVNENIILGRSCEPLRMDDCKTANSIEFCYCTKDLCNIINPTNDEEDEEEFLDEKAEGSGSNMDTTIKEKNLNKDMKNFTSTEKEASIDGQNNFKQTKVFSNCSTCQLNWCLISSVMIYCIIFNTAKYLN